MARTLKHTAYVCDWHDRAVDTADMVRELPVLCTIRMDIRPIKAVARFDWEVSLGDEGSPTHRAICRNIAACEVRPRHWLFVPHRRRGVWYQVLAVQESEDERFLELVLSEVSRVVADNPRRRGLEIGTKYGDSGDNQNRRERSARSACRAQGRCS